MLIYVQHLLNETFHSFSFFKDLTHMSYFHSKVDYISGVMVSILSSSELHRDQAKDYKIGSCCFPLVK